MKKVSDILSSLSTFVWEEFCVFCETPGSYICQGCAPNVPFINGAYCDHCGRPFSNIFGTYSKDIGPHPCGKCLEEKPFYDRHRGLMSYEGVAKDLVHQLKYQEQTWIRHFYERYLKNIRSEFEDVDIIVPIPLHVERLRQRGYNQSQILAQAWQHALRKPISVGNLVRKRNTISQTGLDRQERLKNLKNAFFVKDRIPFQNKKILLVDDVHTTGATLNAASLALKRAGAVQVQATTLAVVPMDSET